MADGHAEGPPHHDPVDTWCVRPLHHSTSVDIYDIGCRPHDFRRGPEECTRAHQIVFPRRGVFERELRGRRVIADMNHVLFFSPYEPYRIAHPSGHGDDNTVFTFDSALLRDAIGCHDPAWTEADRPPFRFTHALNDQRIFFLHCQLRRAALAEHSEDLAIDEAAVRLLAALIRSAYRNEGTAPDRHRDRTSRTHREQMQHTSLLLGTRFREKLSLDAIARATHSSPFHLARVFRRQTGVTIHQYRHRLRLRTALLRVADGETNLSALALDLGFSSHSHLTDAFRQGFGVSPAWCRTSLSSRVLGELSKNLEAAGPSRA